MKKFKELAEQKGRMIMAFGRMNPPTIGHLKLADKVKSVAGSDPYRIYLSQTVGPKDPLPFAKKVAYAKKSFGPKHAKSIQLDKSVKTFINAAQKINQEGYTELVMVAGSDRIQEFQRLLDTYNGKPDKKGNIVFDFPDGVKVVSSGERDPDSADPTEAISASLMRSAAQSGDFETFKKGSPMKEADAKKMYDDVRKFMGVREAKEDLDITSDYDLIRDAYLQGEWGNIGDIVEANGFSGEVVRRGTNYLSFVDEDGKFHKAFLHQVGEDAWYSSRVTTKLGGKFQRKTAPRSFEKMAKQYVDLAKKPEYKGKPNMAADAVARQYKGVNTRTLISYINDLVMQGKLPKELRASYMPTFREATSVKQDKQIKDRPGTQPKKYYAKDAEGDEMSKSTKQARARHFEKGAAKDDDDPSAYKPAPGDKSAKTKLSKHTKKVRQMYPDLYKEEMIPYDVYCNLLDYIGENYHRLNDQTLTEDWWSDLSPSEQEKYISDHPNSEKARTAREKEQGSDDKPSKEKTQQALQDLKTHVGDVAKSVGVDAKVVAKAFKEPSVYNTVNALGGSLSAASKTLIGGARTIGKTLNIGGAAISDTESFKQLEKGVIKVDEFMDKNPALKRVAGATVAGIAAYQWLNMSFSGDIESDYDVSLISAGLSGNASFADLINTPDGVKSMALLGAGLATGGLPIWMGGPVGLGMALAYTGAKKAGNTEAGKKIKKKMLAFAEKAKEKVQNKAKDIDRRLGVNTEERDYKKEYENYHSKPEQIERRSSRNKARRIMGDKAVKGKDIGHKDNNPLNNNPKNLRNEDPSKNRREPRLRENYLSSSFIKKVTSEMRNEQKMECPPATQDVALNTKNRNATRDNHMYGPLNVKEPGDYWEKLAKRWKTTLEAAKKSKCGNCVAFDISPRMDECMPGSVSDESGRLGYCWMHHFKCHSARSCDTWATGGPIKEDDKSYQWQEKAFGKEVEEDAVKDARDKIKREKEADKIKHDAMLDRARLQKARNKNRATESLDESWKPSTMSGYSALVDEGLWDNIRKKRQRIKQGSGERMRKKGEKGAPTPAQMQRAKSEEACCDDCGTDSTLIENNLYRVGSEAYYNYFEAMREKYERGELEVSGFDKELMEGDIGKFATYEEQVVPLDCPMMESEYQGKDVELNKPKAGGPKKYYVYVRDPSTGNVKKVTWGDTTGLKVKLSDKGARKSFAARHKCDQQKDKTKAAYWACNLPRYASQLGLSGGGNFFW